MPQGVIWFEGQVPGQDDGVYIEYEVGLSLTEFKDAHNNLELADGRRIWVDGNSVIAFQQEA